MNTSRRLELAARRGELVALIGVERNALSANMWPVAGTLATADRVLDGIEWLKRRPAIVAAGVAILVVVRAERAWRWGKRAFTLYRGFRALRRHLKI